MLEGFWILETGDQAYHVMLFNFCASLAEFPLRNSTGKNLDRALNFVDDRKNITYAYSYDW